jgi:hypothetical protein
MRRPNSHLTRRLLLAAACLLAASLAAAPAGEAAKRKVPYGFFSATADLGFFYAASQEAREAQARLMARSGVETVRVVFNWGDSQPYPNADAVPGARRSQFVTGPGGVPTSFARTDAAVRFTAQAGLRMLPMIYRTPRWASSEPNRTFFYSYMPADSETFANYLRALIGRYGPTGSFWTENRDLPKVPIREWQIYNEPTRLGNLENQPAHKYYIPLLRTAYRAIHGADRGAKVVAAGLHNISWETLAKLYRHGLKGTFDVAAIHVYTSTVKRVLEVVRLNRRVMRRNRDRKPIYLTETTWSAARGRVPKNKLFGPETTRRGQARLLTKTYRALIRNRRKLGVQRAYWYTWATPERGDSTFLYSGLLQQQGSVFTPKPALGAYARTARRYEGCRKSSDARRCAGRGR